MNDFELRQIREEEFPEVHRVASAAFGQVADPREIAGARPSFERERSACVFEEGRLVGTSSVYSMDLAVPGGSKVPAGGLTWVAVLPTHRRRGVLRRMLTAQLEQMAQRDEVVSVLLSSEGGIYRRFGYGPATWVMECTIERRARLESSPSQAGQGSLVLLDAGEAPKVLPDLYQNLRASLSGEVSRPAGWWSEYFFDPEHHREDAGGMFHVIHHDPSGRVNGYATYRIKVGWKAGKPDATLKVVEVVWADLQVYAALWDYLLNVDLIARVSFSRARTDEPLRWMLPDPRDYQVHGLTDYLWVRILDVPQALATRTYAAPGRVVLEVRTAFPEESMGRYALEVDKAGSRGHCVVSTSEPDLVLDLADLGSIYLGGATFSSVAYSGRVLEKQTGSIWRADSMFSTELAPYCCTMF